MKRPVLYALALLALLALAPLCTPGSLAALNAAVENHRRLAEGFAWACAVFCLAAYLRQAAETKR